MAQCSSCRAEIVWVYTDTAKPKPMPLDPEPGKFGPKGEPPRVRKERVEDDPRGGGLTRKIVHVLRDNELEANTKPLYQSHFVTCPFADQHRKTK